MLCKNTFPRCGNTNQKTGPKTAALRCRANQTENESKQKKAKKKNQDKRKASTNLLALQEHIPTMWEHGPENQSENRSSAMQSKPDREKAKASQASEQRSGKNSPGRRQQRSKARTLKKHFVSTHKRTSKTTHKTHGHPHPATPSQEEQVAFWGGRLGGGVAPNRHPPPKRPPQNAKRPPPPPPKHQKTNAKFWHEFRNNAMELRSRGKASTKGVNRMVSTAPGGQTGAKFPGQFLENG